MYKRCDPQVGQALLSPALEVAVTHLSPDKVNPSFLFLSQFAIYVLCNYFRMSQKTSPMSYDAVINSSPSGPALPGSNYCDRPRTSIGNQTSQKD